MISVTKNTTISNSARGFLELQHASFLQSHVWLHFQKSLNRSAYHFEIQKEDTIIGSCLVIVLPLKFGKTYLYAPYGPVISVDHEEALSHLSKELLVLAKETHSVFFRCDPNVASHSPLQESLIKIGAKQSTKEIQPHETITLDISRDEDDILASFHSKTRYNIRLATRKGVEVQMSTDPNDIDIFYNIAKETSVRNAFGFHKKAYFKKQLTSFADENIGALFIASYQDTPVAVNIAVFDKNQGIYLHGASSNSHRNVMAPHLLQWEQIKEAKKRGCTTYDFWGATSSNNPNHPWHGVTRFKKGFSTHFEKYAGTFDIPFDTTWYTFYTLFVSLNDKKAYAKQKAQ